MVLLFPCYRCRFAFLERHRTDTFGLLQITNYVIWVLVRVVVHLPVTVRLSMAKGLKGDPRGGNTTMSVVRWKLKKKKKKNNKKTNQKNTQSTLVICLVYRLFKNHCKTLLALPFCVHASLSVSFTITQWIKWSVMSQINHFHLFFF